jgi:hypothetical protein
MGEAGIVEDVPDGNSVADACEGGSRLVSALLMPVMCGK